MNPSPVAVIFILLTVLTFLYQTYRNIRHQLQTAKGTLDESKKRKKRMAAGCRGRPPGA